MSIEGAVEGVVRATPFLSGYQFCYLAPGSFVTASGGVDAHGRRISDCSRFAPYCAVKVVLAKVLQESVLNGDLSFNDRLGEIVADLPAGLKNVCVDGLANHSSGVLRPTFFEAVLLNSETSFDDRLRHVSRRPLPEGRTRYTEFVAWWLLSVVIQQATGRELNELLYSSVGGLIDDLDFSHLIADTTDGCLAMGHCDDMPLLLESSPRMRYKGNPGFGGAFKATSLARVMQGILFAGGESGADRFDLSPMFFGQRRADLTFRRHCTFTAGLIRADPDMGFGPQVPPDAICQIGLGGSSLVLGSPLDGTAFCFLGCGLTTNFLMALDLRQRLSDVVFG